MSSGIQVELSVLYERWRARARKFMGEAELSSRHADVVRLTAMASTLEWAATDLSVYVATEHLRAAPTETRGSGGSG